MMTRKTILYIAMSLDGFIARADGDLSWLDNYEVEGQDYGYSSFNEKVDTVVMGRKAYEKVMTLVSEFPHKDKKSYIISSKLMENEKNLEFYNGNPVTLIKKLMQEPGKDIFIDGGAVLIKALKEEGLIDQYFISIIPVFLGNGIRLFHEVEREEQLELIGTRMYENGLVQLRYKLTDYHL